LPKADQAGAVGGGGGGGEGVDRGKGVRTQVAALS